MPKGQIMAFVKDHWANSDAELNYSCAAFRNMDVT
jgi:hypothetical protein